jgi:hypothetical protein
MLTSIIVQKKKKTSDVNKKLRASRIMFGSGQDAIEPAKH